MTQKPKTVGNRNGLVWTEDEHNQLAALIAHGTSYADIAAELGRTEGAIEDRAKELGHHKPKRADAPRLWTAEEDQDLARLWRLGHDDEQIARMLKRRSVPGIESRRRILGLVNKVGKPSRRDKAERREPAPASRWLLGKPDLFALWDERNNRLLARRAAEQTQQQTP